MKKCLKYFFVIAITVMSFFSTSVFALESSNDDNVGLSTIKPTYFNLGVMPYGYDVPTKRYDWSTGPYPMSGRTSNTNLYSDKYFTGMSKLYFQFTRADEKFKIEIWDIDGGFLLFDKKVETIEIDKPLTADDLKKGNTREYSTSVTLKPKSHYYVKVIAPAHFAGYIDVRPFN